MLDEGRSAIDQSLAMASSLSLSQHFTALNCVKHRCCPFVAKCCPCFNVRHFPRQEHNIYIFQCVNVATSTTFSCCVNLFFLLSSSASILETVSRHRSARSWIPSSSSSSVNSSDIYQKFVRIFHLSIPYYTL